MFLASQLEDVARRYPAYVAELRGFFSSRGVVLDSGDSLVCLMERLEGDRGFHRGVSTLLEAIVYREQEQVSPADLLAMLMVAAHGAVAWRPSVAQDQATQALLAFVMRLREEMSDVEEAPPPVVPAMIALEQTQKRDKAPVLLGEYEEPQRSWLRRHALPVGSALLLLLAIGGYGLWYGMQTPLQPAVVVATHPPEQVPAEVPQSSVEMGTPSVEPTSPRPVGREKSRTVKATPSPVIVRSSPSARPQTTAAVPVQGGVPASQSAKAEVQSQQPADNQTASAAPVRRRLPMPAARPRRVPGLGTDSSATVPLEWMKPAAAPAEPRVSSPTVTPTALGIMASNLMYSPAPAYPAEANAAHVEGQVKVEATVGNDGRVTSVRVISGPELLRNAALGAVQQWHYRPYVEGGKARTVTTTALLDFQLP